MWHVYIIECEDGTLYTGATTDVARRFREHTLGRGGHYTRAHAPVAVRYSEACSDRGAALVREAEIKRLPRTEKLQLICTK